MREQTTAEATEITDPVAVPAVDPQNLTDDEKTAVTDAVKAANPNLPADAKIEVADNGEVTITYADGSTDTIPADKAVREQTTADLPKQPDAKAGKALSNTGSQLWAVLMGAFSLMGAGAVALVARKKSER